MNKSKIASLALGVLMVSSGFLAVVLTPTEIPADQQARIDLDTLVPKEFGDWKLEPFNAGGIVNPEVKGSLEKIYSQTLARTYVNKQGDRIMLSIAYGGRQKADLQAHRPEICYASGGFAIDKKTKTYVDTTVGRLPVMQLVAKQGVRNEPITYWVRVGDSLTRGWIEQKITAIGYGLTGKVPDGVLVRISSISNDEQGSYLVQQSFLRTMLQAVRSEDRVWLVGRLDS
ncbi:MAG: EpsI family protein [Gammaproteobacteria bacterium]|nr:EpsI family protein [Gammaproteobacteria bacterium]MBU1777649.1 EpsI family protein [Gammaproteobacteria bacterium]MBU1969715.1 EpsI family protein [Gammaproteobacteria bacterium]